MSEVTGYVPFFHLREPRFVQMDTDRFTNHRHDLFDLEWKLLPFQYILAQQVIAGYPSRNT